MSRFKYHNHFRMKLVPKTLLCVTVAGGAVAAGQFVHREKELKSNLPQNRIDIGNKDKKKAIVIGCGYLLII